jgi:predicted O-methyltransferase YrrM
MPGIGGLISNIRAAASSPQTWWLARQSVTQHGAIQHVDELTVFAKIVKEQRPKRILEIGTAEGGVFWLLCRLAAADATLISLDLPPKERYSGGNKTDINLESMKIPGQTVHVIHGDSHAPETPGQVQKILGNQLLDLLFIDGDHTYEGVSQDYMMYSPLVRPGGMIVFHDIVKSIWPGCQVDQFWGELEQNPSLDPKAIIGYVPSHYGGIGLVTHR